MKSAWIILCCASLIWSIQIKNFDSTGVYFQHQGNVKLSSGRLEYVNVVDLEVIYEYASYFRTAFDAYKSQHVDAGDGVSQIVDTIITDTSSMKETKFPEYYHGNRKVLSNLSNKVKNLVSRLNATTNNLYKGDLPSKTLMSDINKKFESIKKVVEINEFDWELLSIEDFRKDIETMNILKDSKLLYQNLPRLTKVTKSKSSQNKIYISVVIYLIDDEVFNLYKVISVPIIRRQNVVSLQNKYRFLLSFNNQVFVTESDLGNLPNHKNIRIATKNHFISLDEKSCIFGIFNRKENSVLSCKYNTSFENIEKIQDLGNNKYLFAIRDETTYTYTCPEMDHNIGSSDNHIQGTGILTLNEGCTFQTEINEFKAVKIDAVIEPNDKYVFKNIIEGIFRTLDKEVVKDPPEFIPLTKVKSNFETFYESSSKIEQYQEEYRETMEKNDKLIMPKRTSSISQYFF